MEEAEVYLGVQPKRKTIKTPCWVSILLFCKKAKTSKLTVPRGDVDNYAKAVLDAMVKARILQDDNLVVRLSVLKCFDQINKPMVSVSVEPAAVI
jgi:Holliday junction resolvase RusA-like endonuclease